MPRIGFRMSVHAGREQEYEARHNPIWQELEAVLKSHGVSNYSIFLDPSTGDLFGYAEIESRTQWEAIADTPECRKWWASMSELMPSEPDDRPISRELKEVFHLD